MEGDFTSLRRLFAKNAVNECNCDVFRQLLSELRIRRIATKTNHRKLLIKTTSLLSLPRVRASCLPSCDQAKSKICPDLKFVICLGGPPLSFCRQMLETPFWVNTYDNITDVDR